MLSARGLRSVNIYFIVEGRERPPTVIITGTKLEANYQRGSALSVRGNGLLWEEGLRRSSRPRWEELFCPRAFRMSKIILGHRMVR